MGALLSILSPLFFGLLGIFIPNWQTQLCGVLTTFSPVDVCSCQLLPSSTEVLAVDYSLDCLTDDSQLSQCLEFDFNALLPQPIQDLLAAFLTALGLGSAFPIVEYCVDCDFDLDGTATLLGLTGSFDAMFQCGYTLNGWPSALPNILLIDSIGTSISGSVDLDNGVEVTACGGVVPLLDGTPVLGCSCTQEGCEGANQILITCDVQLPLISDFLDLNDFVDVNSLSPLLGTCFDVPDPFSTNLGRRRLEN